MLHAAEKQLEHDVSGRVSESRKCFQLGTQVRDTSREHSTPALDTRSTHIEHHHRDSTCATVITDDELINDDEGKMEEAEQGGDKAINPCKKWKPNASNDRKRAEAADGREPGKYVVHDGKIITPGSIKQLKDHTIVRIVDKMMGGGRKARRNNKEETASSSESDALQDIFINLMNKMMKRATAYSKQ